MIKKYQVRKSKNIRLYKFSDSGMKEIKSNKGYSEAENAYKEMEDVEKTYNLKPISTELNSANVDKAF